MIFHKLLLIGLSFVKYYFQTPVAKKLAHHAISHNDIPETDRGVWRKYNPYNPYVEDDKEKKVENLKVESLDDLFVFLLLYITY